MNIGEKITIKQYSTFWVPVVSVYNIDVAPVIHKPTLDIDVDPESFHTLYNCTVLGFLDQNYGKTSGLPERAVFYGFENWLSYYVNSTQFDFPYDEEAMEGFVDWLTQPGMEYQFIS